MGVNRALPSIYSQRYSASSLRTFFEECEYRFNLVYVQQTEALPDFREPYEVGHNVHEIINRYYAQLINVPTEAEIGQKIRGVFRQYFNFGMKKTQRIQRIMNNFIKFEVNRFRKDPSDYLPIAVEEKFRTAVWTGIYDARFRGIIVDWKTTAKTEPNTKKNIIQASVYFWSARELKYGIKEIWFVFLDSGKPFKMGIIKYDDLIKMVETVERAKNKMRFGKNSTKDCYYCTRRLTCQFDNTSRWLI